MASRARVCTAAREKTLLKMIYAADPKRYAQEVEGAMGDSEVTVFQECWVDRTLATQVRANSDVPFLFLAVDPAAGGLGSDTAWSTHFLDANDRIVVRARASIYFFGGGGGGGEGEGAGRFGGATRLELQNIQDSRPVWPSRAQMCSQSSGISSGGVGCANSAIDDDGGDGDGDGIGIGPDPARTIDRGRGWRGGMRSVHTPRWSKCSRYWCRIASVKCNAST